MAKVAIIGNGWVGKAMLKLFPDAYIYTRNQGEKEEVNKCDVAFICIPTPVIEEGRLDTDGVAEVVSWLETPLIVIRSTLNPGDSQGMEEAFGKKLVVQPEYLGETVSHPLLDETKTPFLIIGGDFPQRKALIELYQTVYNANISIRQVSAYAAEIIKLSENRAIAFKVAQCQELYDVCRAAGVDYYTVRDAVYGDDSRFNLWFTFVYPNNRGFNSKCMPKDVYAWCAYAESVGYAPKLTRAMLEKNKEWLAETDELENNAEKSPQTN